MSNKRIWLSAASVLFLVGCGSNNGNSGNEPYIPVVTPIETPVVSVNEKGDGLIWEDVARATSYEVDINDEETVELDEPEYLFSSVAGEYSLKIVSVAASGEKSEATEFEYESRTSSLSELYCDGSNVTWVIGSSDYYALEYSVDGEHFSLVSESYIPVTVSGVYTVRTVKGYKEQGSIFYSTSVSKSIVVTEPAESMYVLEDASAEDSATLSESYEKFVYKDGNWKDTTSEVSLDGSYTDYVDGNAADFKYWYHNSYFLYEKEISLDGSYNEFSFSVKSYESTNAVLSFQIKQDLVINGINFNGVYIKYDVPQLPTSWTKYRVSLSDSNWKVVYDNQPYDFATIAAFVNNYGFKVQKLEDFLPYFDVFQFRLRASYRDGGPVAHTFFDNVCLLNSELKNTVIETIIPSLKAKESYAFTGNLCSGKISFSEDGTGLLSVSSPMELDLPVKHEVVEGKLHVYSEVEGKDFDAYLTSNDGGTNLVLESVTGTFATYMQGIVAEAVNLLDDFESYESTGVGLDNDHRDESQLSGLRGAYFADYYTGGNGDSPVGGSNWSLMRSSDYNELSKDVYHTGSQSFKLKSNTNTMRFMTWGLKDGTATKGSKGKYFSLWAKGGDVSNMTLRVSVYAVSKVDPSNQVTDSIRKWTDFTVPMNSGWTEYKLELDESKEYYGFSITTKDGGNKQYVYVDDIYIYSSMSPWGK